MERKGVHHVGLATLDIDTTIEFYTRKLGWSVAWCDVIEPPDGGRIRHAFLDTGDGTLVAFMCPERVPGIPAEFKTDINSAQNLPPYRKVASGDVLGHGFLTRFEITDRRRRPRIEAAGRGAVRRKHIALINSAGNHACIGTR